MEDRAGEPFVGPAGRLLDRALEDAGIQRDDTHPSSILRLPDEQRQEAYSALVADLKVIADQAPAR
jgi:uracil-DNA glycosylase family 4